MNYENYLGDYENYRKEIVTLLAYLLGVKDDILKSESTNYILELIDKYENDDTLEEGKEVVEQSGYTGCTSEAYKILKLNGEVVSKTLLSKDTYDPMTRIIRRGTKKDETTQKPSESTSTTENNKEDEEKTETSQNDNVNEIKD